MTKKSSTGIEFEEAVLQAIGELDIPIIFDADIGHVPPQMTLINGAIVNIKSKNGKGEVSFIIEK